LGICALLFRDQPELGSKVKIVTVDPNEGIWIVKVSPVVGYGLVATNVAWWKAKGPHLLDKKGSRKDESDHFRKRHGSSNV
jgi:hypothetical protein